MTFKKISAFLLVCAMVFTFTACDEDENVDVQDAGTKAGTDAAATENKAAVDVKDAKNYFLEVDGKKLTVGDSVQSVVDQGFKISQPALDAEVESEEYTIIIASNQQTDISLVVVNESTSDKKVSQCSVGGFSVNRSLVSDDGAVSIIGGLTIGSTPSEVETVFGKCSDISDSEDSADYISYTYEIKTDSIDISYVFHFFDGDAAGEIFVSPTAYDVAHTTK